MIAEALACLSTPIIASSLNILTRLSFISLNALADVCTNST
ncbi:hypothetical protein IBE48_07770 [Francisella philomiragia]|uniref:Uncharacterized protein n=1 Tax=Francisella philomiragia TaxID=28110 RepID=A0ABS1GA44_9GAMM|nr:hypothetical protein [Francisella philomiragia]MBK2257865.1 hypothetical protein [Francisella philomiragia]MBK2273648.1 hypothetical protein [Francisella philomiragia]MBK2277529.1 hypothetical protein [Francisella philomiragia]MBK2281475.1 hypothetical protein [Francisella philomiragia]